MAHHPPRPAARRDGPLAGCWAPERHAQSWERGADEEIWVAAGRSGDGCGKKNLHKRNSAQGDNGRLKPLASLLR